MPSNLEKILQTTWIHSHEEDEGGKLVFRTSDFAFPRSRGRTAFTLKPLGVAVGRGPGPDDRTRTTTGEWKLTGRQLEIKAHPFSGMFEIETADDQRLVVRRFRKEN